MATSYKDILQTLLTEALPSNIQLIKVDCNENSREIIIKLQNLDQTDSIETDDDKYPLSLDFILERIRKIVVYSLGKIQKLNSYRLITITINEYNRLPFPYYSYLLKTEIKLDDEIDLETGELIWIFSKRIDVLLEEYRTLRQELISTQGSLTNIFYYGLIALGIAFTSIQAILSQLNNYFTVDLDSISQVSQFQALRIFLFILLDFFVPIICATFVIKWLSNSRSIAIKGCYLTGIELELNRAFNRFKKGDKLFDDYELNIGWESNLRRIRRFSKAPFMVFGGFNIFVIIFFFYAIGFISQLLSILLIGGNWLIFIFWLVGCVGYLLLISHILKELGIIRDSLSALSFSEITKLINNNGRNNHYSLGYLCNQARELCKNLFNQNICLALFLICLYVASFLIPTVFKSIPIYGDQSEAQFRKEVTIAQYTKRIDELIIKKENTPQAKQLAYYLAIEALSKLEASKNSSDLDIKSFVKHIYNTGIISKLCRVQEISELGQKNISQDTINLSCANLEKADLIMANLTGANLTKTNLTEAKLEKADLTMANLIGANLTKTNLTEAIIKATDLRGANLRLADLKGADLTGAIGVDCSTLKLAEAKIDKKTRLPDGTQNTCLYIGGLPR